MENKGKEIRVISGNAICREDRGINVGSGERGRNFGRDIAGNIIFRGDRRRYVVRDGRGKTTAGGEKQQQEGEMF